MDHDTLELILEAQREMKGNIKELTDAINTLNLNIVGQDNCANYREAMEKKLDAHDERIRALEDKKRLFDLTWCTVKNNSVLKAFATGLVLSVALPAIGRWNEGVEKFGMHQMILWTGGVVFAIIILWVFMNRDATKRFFKL